MLRGGLPDSKKSPKSGFLLATRYSPLFESILATRHLHRLELHLKTHGSQEFPCGITGNPTIALIL